MAYLPIITAIISGVLVWGLGRWNLIKDERKSEIRRLKRLLYNMLEFKHWVDKEISAEGFTTRYMIKMTEAIRLADPAKSEQELTEMTAMISAGMKRVILKQPQLPRLEQNIAEIIRDYSEIDPFFAYDLTGKYQLTENMDLMKEYLAGVVSDEADMPEATTFINNLLRPAMLADLQKDLISHLPQIAQMIDNKTLEKVNADHLATKTEIDEAALDQYCKEMLPQLISSAGSFAGQPV